MPILFKQCKKCEEWKNASDFHVSTKSKDGFYRHCKQCVSFRDKGYYHSSEEKRKYYSDKAKERRKNENVRNQEKISYARYYQSVEGRARSLYSAANSSHVSDKFKCTVTFEHILNELKRGYCAVTGIIFDLSDNHKKYNRKRNAYAPSLDRINSNDGYTNENTRLVIWQYNAMKGELTDFETIQLCKIISQRYSQ